MVGGFLVVLTGERGEKNRSSILRYYLGYLQ
jgi:hypothetical protein